ncbi:MAG: efflux RND transporter periplasmic adaptor subunit [Terriglobia bacterium]|jgi:RND family efflux transporter MFP subunit
MASPQWGPRAGFFLVVILLALLPSCGRVRAKGNAQAAETVAVAKVARQTLERTITLSAELVPFQDIEVYAKESGYVKKLYVDYGSRVKEGQLMAILEIPELEAQLQEDQGDVKNATDEVSRAQHMLNRYEAMYKAVHLEFTRLNGVFVSKPGLVAQQEVDDAQGKDLAEASQVDAGEAAFEAAQGKLAASQSKLVHDQALFAYARITAPFAGVVTERYANLGTLMQAGIGSSTQALPLVRLSQDNLFRLVIPVPESDVSYIRVGDTVEVRVPSLNRVFPGKVARFSIDVREDTRTMHTEVDVPNPDRILIPGVYAEATLTLEKKSNVYALPLQAVTVIGSRGSVDIVNSADEIESRQVTLGMRTPAEVEIASGVQEGEEVVTSDRSQLKVGQKVKPQFVEGADNQEQE